MSNITNKVAREQLALLHDSMLTKAEVKVVGQRIVNGEPVTDTQIGYVTGLDSEDGSGENWIVWMSTGVRLFVKLFAYVVRPAASRITWLG